ncbi:hypothetical protein Emag_004260 [Eimeria magna]
MAELQSALAARLAKKQQEDQIFEGYGKRRFSFKAGKRGDPSRLIGSLQVKGVEPPTEALGPESSGEQPYEQQQHEQQQQQQHEQQREQQHEQPSDACNKGIGASASERLSAHMEHRQDWVGRGVRQTLSPQTLNP